MILQIAQVGLIILIPPSKESKLDFLINHLLPQDKTSLDSPLVISFSTFILSNRCVSLGCSKDWKNWSVKSYHFPWFVTSMTCPYVWQYENWKIGPNWGPRWIAHSTKSILEPREEFYISKMEIKLKWMNNILSRQKLSK